MGRYLKPPPRAAVFALLAALLLAAAGGVAASPPPAMQEEAADVLPDALLWRARSAGGAVSYLLGSIHVQRPGDLPLPPPVLEAYRRSALLVLELDMDAIAPGELEGALLRFGTAAPARPLRVALGDSWPAVREQLRANGYDADALDRFDPWFVATVIVNQALAKLGFQAELGVESRLSERAREDGKPISGLETVSEQLSLFEALDADTQTLMLIETLDELDSLSEMTTQVVAAWREADVRALRAGLGSSFTDQQELYEALVAARNRRWIPALLSLLETPQTELIVVGALHVIGEQSVVTLLRERGVQIDPVW